MVKTQIFDLIFCAKCCKIVFGTPGKVCKSSVVIFYEKNLKNFRKITKKRLTKGLLYNIICLA